MNSGMSRVIGLAHWRANLEISGFRERIGWQAFHSGRLWLSRLAFSGQLTPPRGDGPDVCFLWIPKTAGTSVWRWLEVEMGMRKLKRLREIACQYDNAGPVTFGHIHYGMLLERRVVSSRYHKRSHRFAIVRNPYDRSVSLYHHHRRDGHIPAETSFIDYLRMVDEKRPQPGLYNVHGISQSAPQTSWILSRDGEMLADDIWRQEALEQMSADMVRRYGLAPFDRWENAGGARGSGDDPYADPRCVEIVRRVYADDFRLLGYDVERPL